MTFDTTVRDTREKLLRILNESGLHIDVIDMMLELLYLNIHRQAEDIYKLSLTKKPPEGGDDTNGAE